MQSKICWVVCFMASTLSASDVSSNAAPKLICEDAVYSFGACVNTQTVTHTFLLRNIGGATAVISRVHSTCGCTTANPTRMRIPPGESEPVTAHLNLHGKTGAQNRPLYVNWNNPSNMPVRLSFVGSAVPIISVDPGNVYFGFRATDNPTCQTVRIAGFYTNDLFYMTGSTCTATRFVSTIETNAPGQVYLLRILDTQPEITGETNAVITVTGSHPFLSTIRIPLRKFASKRNSTTGGAR